jgi:hypothetical protein
MPFGIALAGQDAAHFLCGLRWICGSATSELDRLLDAIIGRMRCSASSSWAAVVQDHWLRRRSVFSLLRKLSLIVFVILRGTYCSAASACWYLHAGQRWFTSPAAHALWDDPAWTGGC